MATSLVEHPRLYEWSQRLRFQRDQRLLTFCRLPGHSKRLELLNPSIRESNEQRSWVIDQHVRELKGLPPITQSQIFDYYFYLPNDMLTKVDRASMANSLEVRVPFLSKSVAELAFRIPERLRVSSKQSKLILRELMHRYFGPEHARRRKKGFSVPLMKWIEGADRAALEARLVESEYVRQGLLQTRAIRQKFHELQDHGNSTSRRWRNAQSIFLLLAFDSWWRFSYQSG
jgi:asparagine synthase (glutamine-hydrolysing)